MTLLSEARMTDQEIIDTLRFRTGLDAAQLYEYDRDVADAATVKALTKVAAWREARAMPPAVERVARHSLLDAARALRAAQDTSSGATPQRASADRSAP